MLSLHLGLEVLLLTHSRVLLTHWIHVWHEVLLLVLSRLRLRLVSFLLFIVKDVSQLLNHVILTSKWIAMGWWKILGVTPFQEILFLFRRWFGRAIIQKVHQISLFLARRRLSTVKIRHVHVVSTGWLQVMIEFLDFTRDELLRSPSFLDSFESSEGELQVIIDHEANVHDILVLSLLDETI